MIKKIKNKIEKIKTDFLKINRFISYKQENFIDRLLL